MKKNTKGITLITLVVTTIVLLILAGVSISMLTGQNGILTQAQSAKTTTENKSAEEKVKLAVMSARTRTETASLELDKLKEEITNQGGTTINNEFPLNVTMDGKGFKINNDGNIVSNKTMNEITGKEQSNTNTQDSLGNLIVIPAGFKVINPTDNVTDGIVIEDVNHEATAGSQFVWIPVGNVIKDSEGSTETITLCRYVFKDDGTVDTTLSKTEPGDQLKFSSSSSFYFTEGLKDSSTKNTHAKDIEAFRTKVESNHGYYIGRYEARDKVATEARTSSSSKLNQVVYTANNYVYTYVTQEEAAEFSKRMYNDNNFESDLVNSYAWDTALYFLQTFDNRDNKDNLKPYSQQTTYNGGSLASQGTNNIELRRQDEICNVWDMASNCKEWSTETYCRDNYPCIARGGYYYNSPDYASMRSSYDIDRSYDDISFRSLLYM